MNVKNILYWARGGRYLKRWLIITILIIIAALGVWFWTTHKTAKEGTKSNQTESVKKETTIKSKLRIVATGDMIAHDSINANAKKPDGSYDYLSLMDQMKPFFDKSDVNFCNQATPAGGESFGISGYPVFNAPIEFARGIEAVGCNVINIGTNHSNDKGQSLIDASVTVWDNRPKVLAVAGENRNHAEKDKIRYFTKNSVKFAFLSYVTYTNKPVTNGYGVSMYDSEFARQQISQAKQNSDFVIVSMRWGTEYSTEVNTQQDRIAQQLADYGADVVFGHGTHTLQPVKKLTGKNGQQTIVWFSLGNFLNSQIEIESLISGFAIMDIDISTKKIIDIEFMPVYQHYEWTATQKAANNLLSRTNFEMVPLDKAAILLAKSQNNTTVEDQLRRINSILSKYTQVPLITSEQF